MNTEIANTIEVLVNKIKAKEDEANRLKKLINELCLEEGLDPRYQNVSDSSSGGFSIRGDEFYGVPITTAIRSYLDKRKSSNKGPASVSDIYEAIKSGGYKFETETEEYAKTTVRNNLRKSSGIFHKLPNGDFGLLSWYPAAKTPKSEDADSEEHEKKRPAHQKRTHRGPQVTHAEIKEVITKITGEFGSSDVEKLTRSQFPTKEIAKAAISNVMFTLTKGGILKIVSPRHGAKGAVYSKA